MENWFTLNRRFPQYWLHVYYLANPDGSKQLWRETLLDFFGDQSTDVRRRLYQIGATGDLADHEKVANEEYERLKELADPLRWHYLLLRRTCTFLRDEYTLCPVWATEILITIRSIDIGVSKKRTAIAIGDRWREITTVDQWAGLSN